MYLRVLKLCWHKSKTLLGYPKTPLKSHTEALYGAGWYLHSYILWDGHCFPHGMGMTPLGVTGHIVFQNYIFILKIFLQKVDLRRTMFFEVVLEDFFFCGGGFEAAGEEGFYLLTPAMLCFAPEEVCIEWEGTKLHAKTSIIAQNLWRFVSSYFR